MTDPTKRLLASVALEGAEPRGATPFSKLSPAAQTLIVDAAMGCYDKSGPPDIEPSVRAEIAAWLATDEQDR